MSGYRNPFTTDEERTILNYIFQKNGFYRLRGLQFWKELSRDELPSRTFWSLHERFRKHIINNIQNPAYGLTYEEQLKLKRIYEELARGKKSSTKPVPLPVCGRRTEAHGNLARNFFEMSDSDDSGGGRPSEHVPRRERRTKSNGSHSSKLINEEIKTGQDGNRNFSDKASTPVIEIGSSSDSEVFFLED